MGKDTMFRYRLSLLLIVLSLCGTKTLSAQEYRNYEDVLAALNTLQNSRPDIAKVVDIGTSWEGRTIRAIKISDDPNMEDSTEEDILFTGMHHAREWISVEVPLRLAEYLVANYSDPMIQELIDNREIWIVPLTNPDGYEYSRSSDSQRLWRKNRRDLSFGFSGVDLNRNYGFQFGGVGSSSLPGSDTYRGPEAFSEPETQAIRDLVLAHDFISLISYHSFTQAILYPWSYTRGPAPDVALLRSVGERMGELIKSVHNKTYCVGQATDCINYVASGDLTDWAYAEMGILAYTIELRPETVPPGFELPPSEIIPTFEENLPAALFAIGLSRGRVMDFEDGTDAAPIRSTIPGMAFTTTEGFDWIYGDQRNPRYNVQPAPDPSGPFASNQNYFAWLGPNQGQGRIDFTDSSFKTVGFSFSSLSPTVIEAFDSDNALIDLDTDSGNLSTGRLDRLSVQGEIAHVLVHDTGNFWLIDDLFVSDALAAAQAKVPGKFARELEVVDSYLQGTQNRYEFTNSNDQFLNIVLEWPGSAFRLDVFNPDGDLVEAIESDDPPIQVSIENAQSGTWAFEVTATDVTLPEPGALVVATFDPDDVDRDGIGLEFDNCPTEINPIQEDSDGDGIGNACDNCPDTVNPDQHDLFPTEGPEGPGNNIGDACEMLPQDYDGDGVDNMADNCPGIPNPAQLDVDMDGIGYACDTEESENLSSNPSIPGGFRYEVYSETTAELFWNRSSDDGAVVGYDITRNGVLVETRDASSYYDDSLIPNVIYTYTIAAVDNQGNRSAISTVSFTASGNSVPSGVPTVPPGFRYAVYSDTAAELFWNRSSDDGRIVGYKITRNGALVETLDATSYFDDSLSPGVTYNYRIVAIDDDGNSSGTSTVRFITGSNPAPIGNPTIPTGFRSAVYSGTAAELFWQRSSDDEAIVGYEVLRDGVVVETRDATSYFDDSLSPGVTYNYRLVAVDNDGNRSPSNMLNLTTNNE